MSENTDFLTGFYLRGAFSSLFHKECCRSSREADPLSMILIDIDHFKSVNDRFGHTRGDQVLREFAARLRRAVRSSDLLFRYGGDEFVILLPGTPMTGARSVAATVMERVSVMKFPGDPDLSLTISMGLASLPSDGSKPEDIFEKADARLYQAKRQGRGRVSHTDDGDDARVAEGPCRPLLERDVEMDAARAFLHEFPTSRKGILVITGPPRSGKRSLCEAVVCMGEMTGMETLHIDPFAVVPGLRSIVPAASGTGLMVVLDGAGQMGSEDLHGISKCVLSEPRPIAVIMVAHDLSADAWGMVSAFPLSEVIHLGPVSLPSTRIWLRTALGVEPSREFTGWFHSETGGLPGNFQPAVRYLERRLYLVRNKGSLAPSSRYWEFDLSRALNFMETGFRAGNMPSGFATSFVGRRVVTSVVIEHLRSGQAVCLSGPGGAGKTRTALHAASMLEEEFRNGVCFVPLSGRNADQVLPAMATALDLRLSEDQDHLVQLCAFLSEKEMLLILDGIEGAEASFGVIESVRSAAPTVRFILTSRSSMDIGWVTEVELAGLPVPATSMDADGSEAVDLFLQVARRVRSGFKPSSGELGDIAGICRAVDGLPLALELAASLMSGLGCSEIRDNVEGDLISLATDDDAVPERHRSMEAVFRQSWILVPPGQQACLRRLSVFRGVFTPAAAAGVAGADPELLSGLQHRWMVRRTVRGRWFIPRMIRSFLERVLEDDPEEHTAAMEAHCNFFSGYLSQMEESLFAMVDWSVQRREMDSALEDIEQAWEWALSNDRPQRLAEMLRPLVLFFRSRGLLDAGIELLRGTSNGISSMPGPGGTEPVALKALVDVSLGLLLFLKGDLHGATVSIDAAMNLSPGSLDPWTEGCILDHAGFVKFKSGEYTEAAELLTRSSALFLEAGRRRDYLQARSDLGVTLLSLGEVDRADGIVSETLEECRSGGYRRLEFDCLQSAGYIAVARGDHESARENFMKYLAYARENGLAPEIAKTLNDLAGIAASTDEYEESEQLYRQALKVFTDLGNRNGQAGVDFNLGIIAQMRGRQEVAEEHYLRTLGYAEGEGERYLELGSHTGLSFVHASRGEHAEAINHLVHAYEIADAAGARPQALRALYGIAETLFEAGRPEEAAEFFYLCSDDPANNSENQGFIDKLRNRLTGKLSQEVMEEAHRKAAHHGTTVLDRCRALITR